MGVEVREVHACWHLLDLVYKQEALGRALGGKDVLLPSLSAVPALGQSKIMRSVSYAVLTEPEYGVFFKIQM